MRYKILVASAFAGAILLTPGVAWAKTPCHPTTTTTVKAVATTTHPCKTTSTTSATHVQSTATTTAPKPVVVPLTTSSVPVVGHAGTPDSSGAVKPDDSVARMGGDVIGLPVEQIPTQVAQPITVTRAASQTALARTGFNWLPYAITGVALFAIGELLMWLGSRKNKAVTK